MSEKTTADIVADHYGTVDDAKKKTPAKQQRWIDQMAKADLKKKTK